MKALKMEESVQEIVKRVGELGRHMNAFHTFFEKLGNNLSTTVNMYNGASKEFKKIDKDVYKITDGKEGGQIEALLLEKPAED
jgi:DNA anti-recombination protein RmuC